MRGAVELFPYQVEGARFLAERGRALLADEMGLGKSAQAIAACEQLGARDRCVLVVCPASVVENWRREFKKFSKLTPVVVSYNKASALCTEPPPGDHWDAIILDEAHYLKTRTAKRTRAIFGDKCDGRGGLVERAKHVFLLTGTPTPNNPSELWPMLRAVMPETISKEIRSEDASKFEKPLAYWPFITRYCKLVDKGFGPEITGGKNLTELKARIAPFVLRRKKDEVLKDLPPIRFDELPLEGRVDLTPEMEDSAIAIAEALRDDGVAGLAKIASHVATLRRLTGLAKVTPAVEWLKDWFDAGGRKMVCFAQHRDVLKMLNTDPRLNRVMRCCVMGDTLAETRHLHVDTFQQTDRPALFLGQIQAAGTGITLTAASDVLFVESSWVPAENEQAAMRVHRIGQRNACLVRFAMLANSIDEQVQRAVLRKTADIEALWG